MYEEKIYSLVVEPRRTSRSGEETNRVAQVARILVKTSPNSANNKMRQTNWGFDIKVGMIQ